MKTRFSNFFNISEFIKLFKEIVDIQIPPPVPDVKYISVETEASNFHINIINALAEKTKNI